VANTLTNVIPQLLAQSLPTLRENALMPRLVNRSIDAENRERGDTIDVPVPTAIAQRDVTAAVTAATNQDTAATKVQVILNQWKEASFHLSDKDAESVFAGLIPMQAAEAVKAIANGADSFILGKYTGVYQFGGTAGTTPFATALTAFKDARKYLNKSAAPMGDRRVVLDSDAEANALVLSQFLKADERGDQGGILDGQIGRKLGADWFLNQNVPTHTAGTWAITGVGYTEVKTSVVAGVQTVIIQGNSSTTTNGGTLVVGDVFKIAGETYVVTVSASVAVAAQATLSIQFSPALKVAAPVGTTVSFGGATVGVGPSDHQVNLLFHRDFLAFASRPLSRSQMSGGGAMFMSVADPISGLALRLEVARQYKQWTYSYDLLYGATAVRPELAARILG
jgi:hypothetical protein